MLEATQIYTQTKRINATEFEALYPNETLDHIELIEGEIVIMPTPTPQHQDAVINLTLILGSAIKSNQLGRLQVAPSDVYFDQYTILQPDLFFVSTDNQNCFVNEQNRWQGSPDLCIEILSPSTGKQDRERKFRLYESFGVREYWIVDPFTQTIEVFVRGETGYSRQGFYEGDETIQSTVLPPVNFQAKAIFTA